MLSVISTRAQPLQCHHWKEYCDTHETMYFNLYVLSVSHSELNIFQAHVTSILVLELR